MNAESNGFRGKRAVVTGASSGIGLQLALQLAQAGADVVAVARRADRLEQVCTRCREYGVKAIPVLADMSIPGDCQRTIQEATSALGGLNLLVLNAGTDIKGRVDEVRDGEVFNTVMKTNYLGPVHCTWHALSLLKQSRGTVVVVSSLQGKTGFPRSAAYSASKHALHGFFDSLRIELMDTGVRIVVVCPGAVESEIRPPELNAQPGVMSAEECARQILVAARKGKRELLMTFGGKLGGWLRPFVPGLIDDYVRKRVKGFYGKV